MLSHNTYRLTWVSLTLDKGHLLTATPPDLERGVVSLASPVPMQPLLLTLDEGYFLMAAPPTLNME